MWLRRGAAGGCRWGGEGVLGGQTEEMEGGVLWWIAERGSDRRADGGEHGGLRGGC